MKNEKIFIVGAVILFDVIIINGNHLVNTGTSNKKQSSHRSVRSLFVRFSGRR